MCFIQFISFFLFSLINNTFLLFCLIDAIHFQVLKKPSPYFIYNIFIWWLQSFSRFVILRCDLCCPLIPCAFLFLILFMYLSMHFIDLFFCVIPGELSFLQSIQWMDLGYSIFGYHHWSLRYKEAECAVACFKQSHVCPLPNRLILDFSIMNKLYVNLALYPPKKNKKRAPIFSLSLSRAHNQFLQQFE